MSAMVMSGGGKWPTFRRCPVQYRLPAATSAYIMYARGDLAKTTCCSRSVGLRTGGRYITADTQSETDWRITEPPPHSSRRPAGVVSPLPRPAGCQLNASKRASGLFCRPTRNRWTAKSSRTVVGRRPATRLKRGGQREVAMQSEGATKVAGRNRRSGLRAGRQWTCVVPCRPATERTVCPPLSNYSFLIIVRNSKKNVYLGVILRVEPGQRYEQTAHISFFLLLSSALLAVSSQSSR